MVCSLKDNLVSNLDIKSKTNSVFYFFLLDKSKYMIRLLGKQENLRSRATGKI